MRHALAILVGLILGLTLGFALRVWDYPRSAMQHAEARTVEAAGGANRFVHTRELLGPDFDAVVKPNNDTLYSSAWVDLSAGPVVLDYPAMGERYFSFQFQGATTDVFAVISRRTHGGAAGRAIIGPPGASSPEPAAGETVIRSPDMGFWLLGRVLIDGPDDLAELRALQDAMTLRPLGN